MCMYVYRHIYKYTYVFTDICTKPESGNHVIFFFLKSTLKALTNFRVGFEAEQMT